MADVVVTGLGTVSSIGTGKLEAESSLRELRHGFECWDAFKELKAGSTVAAPLRGFDVSSTNAGAQSPQRPTL